MYEYYYYIYMHKGNKVNNIYGETGSMIIYGQPVKPIRV